MAIVPLMSLAMAFGVVAMPARELPQPQFPLLMTQASANACMAELPGTEWLLKSLRDADADMAIGSSLAFDKEGNAFGNGGCNRFRGSAMIDGNALKFGDLASTMMACEEPKMAQEAAFHAALAETAAFGFEEGDLLLLNRKDEIVARLFPAK